MAGEYRSEQVLAALDKDVSELIRSGVRLALVNQPIIGCVIKQELVTPMANAFAALKTDVGDRYATGLRSGSMVPVVPCSDDGNRQWRCGELFFKA